MLTFLYSPGLFTLDLQKYDDGNEKYYEIAGIRPITKEEYIKANETPWGGSFVKEGDPFEPGIEVKIPERINGIEITDIAMGAFSSFPDLKSVYIPKTVINIEPGAFKHIKGKIKTFEVDPENPVYITLDNILYEKEAGNIKLIKSYKYNNKTVEKTPFTADIGPAAFAGTGILEITVTGNKIGTAAFSHCGQLERVFCSGSVNSIGTGAFEECRELVSFNSDEEDIIVIPGSVKAVNSLAFSGCTSVKKLVIKGGVEKIEMRAFAGCSSLKEIEINGDIEIDKTAFEKCVSLKRIYAETKYIAKYQKIFPGVKIKKLR